MTHIDDVSKKHGVVACQQSIQIPDDVKDNISKSLVPMILYLIFWVILKFQYYEKIKILFG